MLALATAEAGSGDPPALVLHGFTGSPAAVDELVQGLSLDRRVLAPALVGHGSSPAPPDTSAYSTTSMVGQVAAVIESAQPGPVDLVGYSMGARLALCLALARPDLVRRLALIGANPGIADQPARAERRRSDEALADSIERDGIVAFVDWWQSLPLFESQRSLPEPLRAQIRTQRLAQRPAGLANSLRGFGAGAMEPMWDRLANIDAPVLLLAGESDSKYVAIAAEAGALVPNATTAVVAGVGHATHLEDLDSTLLLIQNFLRE